MVYLKFVILLQNGWHKYDIHVILNRSIPEKKSTVYIFITLKFLRLSDNFSNNHFHLNRNDLEIYSKYAYLMYLILCSLSCTESISTFP